MKPTTPEFVAKFITTVVMLARTMAIVARPFMPRVSDSPIIMTICTFIANSGPDERDEKVAKPSKTVRKAPVRKFFAVYQHNERQLAQKIP